MKTLFIFSSLFVFLFCTNSSFAQNKKEIYYSLHYEYSSELSSNLDSTFIITCNFNLKDLEGYKKIKVKTGNKRKTFDEQYLDLIESEKVKKDKRVVHINIGTTFPGIQLLEIILIDEKNNEHKAILKI